MTLSCYTLITGLLLPTHGVRRTQGVICYLRRFSFPGAGCVKECSFPSSSVASYRREHSSGLLFKAQFGIVSVLRFVGVTEPIFYRPFLHKQHLRGVFPSLGADYVRICLFTQQQTSLQGTVWLSGYSCWTEGCSKPFLDPFQLQPCYACTGGFCRSYGPYYIGSSSASTSSRGFLSHDDGISNAASSLCSCCLLLGSL